MALYNGGYIIIDYKLHTVDFLLLYYYSIYGRNMKHLNSIEGESPVYFKACFTLTRKRCYDGFDFKVALLSWLLNDIYAC